MRKLNKREFILIQLALIMAIAAGSIYFVIMPVSDKITETEENIATYSVEQNLMKSTIAAMSKNQSEAAQKRAQLATLIDTLYKPMAPEQVDELISGLTRKHRLVPQTLTIDNTSYSSVSPFADVVGTSSTSTTTQTEEETNAAKPFICQKATMSATGTMENVLALLNEVEENAAMRVTEFSVQTRNNALTNTNDLIIHLGVEVYSFNEDLLPVAAGN